MNTPQVQLNADDVFLLGNIAAMSIFQGRGEGALPILHLLRDARPDNAGSQILEAMYMFSIGQTAQAIAFLEDSDAFDAVSNRDEAVACHLYLLQQDGQIERACELGQVYLDEDLVETASAMETVRQITAACRAALGVTGESEMDGSIPELEGGA